MSFRFLGINASLLLFAIILFTFMPSVSNDFVDWDDYGFVTENPHISRLDLKSLLRTLTTFHQGTWHPLTWLSHGIDRALWGNDPSFHHLINVILHALNVVLVFRLCIRLQEAWEMKHPGARSTPNTFKIVAAFTAALLFGLHPLRVESVTWISERKDVLSSFFFLGALLSYLSHVSAVGSSCHRRVSYVLSFVSCSAAVLSKPMAITVPFVLLLLDYYPLDRLKPGVMGSRIKEKLPFLAVSLVALVMNMAAKWGEAIPFSYVPAYVRIMNGFHSVVFYLWQTIIPAELLPLYPIDLSVNYFGPTFLLSALVVIAVSCATVLGSLRGRRMYLTVWLSYLVTLAPALGLFMSFRHSAADRYTYVPTIGLWILAGLGVGYLWNSAGRLRYGPAAKILLGLSVLIVALGYGYRTREQIAVWKNSETLWTYVVEHVHPVPDIAYYALGKVYEKQGLLDEAQRSYRRALTRNPQSTRFAAAIARVLARGGEGERAKALLEQLIEREPENPYLYVTLGKILGSMGNYDDAIQAFEKALSLDHDHAPALAMLAFAHVKRNEREQAQAYYSRYISMGYSLPAEIADQLKQSLHTSSDHDQVPTKGSSRKARPW
jgi:Tfp pilus assembly protein PilF